MTHETLDSECEFQSDECRQIHRIKIRVSAR